MARECLHSSRGFNWNYIYRKLFVFFVRACVLWVVCARNRIYMPWYASIWVLSFWGNCDCRDCGWWRPYDAFCHFAGNSYESLLFVCVIFALDQYKLMCTQRKQYNSTRDNVELKQQMREKFHSTFLHSLLMLALFCMYADFMCVDFRCIDFLTLSDIIPWSTAENLILYSHLYNIYEHVYYTLCSVRECTKPNVCFMGAFCTKLSCCRVRFGWSFFTRFPSPRVSLPLCVCVSTFSIVFYSLRFECHFLRNWMRRMNEPEKKNIDSYRLVLLLLLLLFEWLHHVFLLCA